MKLFLLVISFVVFATASCAQTKDELSVRKILSDQITSWNKGQLKNFMQGYWQNDSLKFIGKSGLTFGWNETLKKYKERYPDTAAMGKLAFNIIEVKQLSPRYMFVTGKWQLIRTAGDLSGYFTLLLEKIKSKWFIIADHSS